jgi:hypothetical protein
MNSAAAEQVYNWPRGDFGLSDHETAADIETVDQLDATDAFVRNWLGAARDRLPIRTPVPGCGIDLIRFDSGAQIPATRD